MHFPIGSRVVVQPDGTKDMSEGGIIIPDMAKEKPLEGTVVFIGPNVKQAEVGDRVLYTKFTGTETVLDGFATPVLIMREEDVLLIVRNPHDVA